MTEPEDILVSGEFAAFRTAYGPAVRPAGTNAVRLTVRRRRQRTAVAIAAAVVLAVVVPMGAHARLNRSDPSPVPGQTAEPTPTQTPAETPAPATPTPTGTTASPTPPRPDGRISRAQLLAARVDLPDWPPFSRVECATDDARLHASDRSGQPVLQDLHHGDVDGDGDGDAIALISCPDVDVLTKQVVAFSRDSNGRIVTLGRVVATHQGGPEDITKVAVTSDGTVRVEVVDVQPCCGMPDWWQQKQWRTYAWSGARFEQTAGPTRFGVDPRLTDLTLTAGELVLDAPDADGRRIGSVTVTVTNKGPVDVPQLGFYNLSVGERAGGDLSRCRMVPATGGEACLLEGLRSGAKRSYTFRFLIDSARADVAPSLLVEHFDDRDRNWMDRNRSDNSVELRVNR